MADTKGTDLRDFRDAPRVETVGGEVRLSFFSLANFLEAYSENVSLGGIFVITDKFLPKGTRFRIIINYGKNSQEQFQGFSEVVWIRKDGGKDRPAGMGLKFLFLDPEGQELINLILRHRGNAPGVFEEQD